MGNPLPLFLLSVSLFSNKGRSPSVLGYLNDSWSAVKFAAVVCRVSIEQIWKIIWSYGKLNIYKRRAFLPIYEFSYTCARFKYIYITRQRKRNINNNSILIY